MTERREAKELKRNLLKQGLVNFEGTLIPLAEARRRWGQKGAEHGWKGAEHGWKGAKHCWKGAKSGGKGAKHGCKRAKSGGKGAVYDSMSCLTGVGSSSNPERLLGHCIGIDHNAMEVEHEGKRPEQDSAVHEQQCDTNGKYIQMSLKYNVLLVQPVQLAKRLLLYFLEIFCSKLIWRLDQNRSSDVQS